MKVIYQGETQVTGTEVKVRPTAQDTQSPNLEADWKKKKKMKLKKSRLTTETRKVNFLATDEASQKTELLGVGEACEAIFRPAPCFKDRRFNSSGLAAEAEPTTSIQIPPSRSTTQVIRAYTRPVFTQEGHENNVQEDDTFPFAPPPKCNTVLILMGNGCLGPKTSARKRTTGINAF